MAQIQVTKTHMLIKLTKAEQIMSLHKDLKIPAALIRGADVADKDIWKTLGLRLPGTALPTYLAFGSYLRFGKTGGWTFALWRSTHQNLVITLATTPGQRYKRLIINTDNPQALADEINDALVAC